MKISNSLHIIEGLENLKLQFQLPPDLTHCPQRGVMIRCFYGCIQKGVSLAVDVQQLLDGVQVLLNDSLSIFKRDRFHHCNL